MEFNNIEFINDVFINWKIDNYNKHINIYNTDYLIKLCSLLINDLQDNELITMCNEIINLSNQNSSLDISNIEDIITLFNKLKNNIIIATNNVFRTNTNEFLWFNESDDNTEPYINIFNDLSNGDKLYHYMCKIKELNHNDS